MPAAIKRDNFKEWNTSLSGDDTALSATISVAANRFGVIYDMYVFLDVASETDLENLPAILLASVTIGDKVFPIILHPLVEHTSGTPTNFRNVRIGPWRFEFGPDGFYSGVPGDDIVIAFGAAGTGIKFRVNHLTGN